MKNKKMIAVLTVLVIVAAVVIGVVVAKKNAEPTISKNAETVIRVTLTGPNPDLYDPNNVISMGVGVKPTEEEKAKYEKRSKEIEDNWKAAIGDCFAENCFNGYYPNFAVQFLVFASLDDVPLAVKDMVLQDKHELGETVLVTYTMGEEEKQATFVFQTDKEGKITRVTVS